MQLLLYPMYHSCELEGLMAARVRVMPFSGRSPALDGWYVDDRCINCDAARQLAPGLIGEAGGRSKTLRPPDDEAETRRLHAAAFACPTRSIRPAARSGSRPVSDGLGQRRTDVRAQLPAYRRGQFLPAAATIWHGNDDRHASLEP